MGVIGLVIFIVFLAAYVCSGIYQINIGIHYQNVINVLMAAGFFVFIQYMDGLNLFGNIKDKLIAKIIVSISICSYGRYFAHFIIIRFLRQFDIQSNKLVLFVLILIVLSSWLLTYLLSKIPYIKKVCGV